MDRLAKMLLLVAISLAASGCGWSAVDTPGGIAARSPAPVASARWESHIRGWQRALRAAAAENPTATYPTPSRSVLLERLHQTSLRYRFRVVSVHIVRAPQGSPEVIVQAADPRAFARSVPAIMRILDPRHPATEDWLGWSYEGFFLGAQDSRQRPILAVYNTMRFHSGGQWARAERLFPYPHG
jgi:hypothetical protein